MSRTFSLDEWAGRIFTAGLAERFADIDFVQVRKVFAEVQQVTQKYPKRMAEVFKIPDLPQRLVETPPKKAVLS